MGQPILTKMTEQENNFNANIQTETVNSSSKYYIWYVHLKIFDVRFVQFLYQNCSFALERLHVWQPAIIFDLSL